MSFTNIYLVLSLLGPSSKTQKERREIWMTAKGLNRLDDPAPGRQTLVH